MQFWVNPFTMWACWLGRWILVRRDGISGISMSGWGLGLTACVHEEVHGVDLPYSSRNACPIRNGGIRDQAATWLLDHKNKWNHGTAIWSRVCEIHACSCTFRILYSSSAALAVDNLIFLRGGSSHFLSADWLLHFMDKYVLGITELRKQWLSNFYPPLHHFPTNGFQMVMGSTLLPWSHFMVSLMIQYGLMQFCLARGTWKKRGTRRNA